MTRDYAQLPEMNMPFDGAKLALLCGGDIVVLLRDEIEGIPFPGYWDLPGGGREGQEMPLACALRETEEELGLRPGPGAVTWGRCFGQGPARTWFFVGVLPEELLSRVMLGAEGQAWARMDVARFLGHPKVVPHFQHRLRIYLGEVATVKNPPLR